MKKKQILIMLCTFICVLTNTTLEKPTLLIKLATRSRPQQFFKNLNIFYQKLSHEIPYLFLISCDNNDETMNNPTVIKRLESYPNLEYSFSENNSKIEACNRDINKYDFDILLAVHDDMQAMVKNFDQIIVHTMTEHFPDFDGVLNFNDGYIGGQCNTIPVVGKKFYDRFGYLYNPEYKALVANLELTNISKMLKKEHIVNQVIIRHNHPAWGTGRNDPLYTHNEQYHEQDLQTFIQRRSNYFDLPKEILEPANSTLWSILICTIEGREESFEQLTTKLLRQIKALGLSDHIEILSCKDKRGDHTIGAKRNMLLQASSGIYTQFLDDDDDIADNFIEMIYEKLQKKPDCVSLTGIIKRKDLWTKKFIHSRKYTEYFEKDDVFYRCPNHLNPIRRCISVQFSFPEKNYWEDTEWAMAISRSELIKTEEEIDTPYYFYNWQSDIPSQEN